jgi:hypothetical protein
MTEDATLGGYIRKHERPPAFSGSDGRAYSVALYVEDSPDAEGRYGAAILFVRWNEGGTAPEGHVETDVLAYGATPEKAQKVLEEMSLHDVKAHLDRVIAERVNPADW